MTVSLIGLKMTVATYLGLVTYAAVRDVREFRIPNACPAGAVLLFPAVLLLSPVPVPWEMSLLVAFLVLAAGLVACRRAWVGAGDVKLCAAVSLWTFQSGVMVFLNALALAGAGLAAAAVLLRLQARIRGAEGRDSRPLGQTRLPFGVAIAIAAWYAAPLDLLLLSPSKP